MNSNKFQANPSDFFNAFDFKFYFFAFYDI